MLNNQIKEITQGAHQQLEKRVIMKLKAIRSDADYADLLKYFYSYFSSLEKEIYQYVTADVLPDLAERRKSGYLKNDIEELGANIIDLPQANVPTINSIPSALGAMYVMEGSIMGGPHIIQILRKYGIEKGFSFFSGYAENTGKMWTAFTGALNNSVATDTAQAEAIRTADETFANFSDMFQVKVA